MDINGQLSLAAGRVQLWTAVCVFSAAPIEMAESFKVQFLQAILYFDRVLKLCGVCICPSGSKRKLALINLWSSVWLISNFQIQLFVFINRVYYVQFLPLSEVSSFNLRETLIHRPSTLLLVSAQTKWRRLMGVLHISFCKVIRTRQ